MVKIGPKDGMAKWLVVGVGILVGAFVLSTAKFVVADDDDGDSDAPSAPSKHRAAFARERVNKGENKETDGTTAANRFQAETVIKSQYKLDGEQLEVDPD